MSIRLHAFDDASALANALASKVAAALQTAISERGKAEIAVSGGSTPKLFFRALSARDIDWDKVVVTLVDERLVPAGHERSNHRLVASELLRGKAAAARFMPLYQEAPSPGEAAAKAGKALAGIGNPFDVVILGMGKDGHTASFFPDGDNLAAAIDPASPRGVVAMEAPSAGEPRLTFTFASLEDARFLALHIEGPDKKDTLDRAISGVSETEMPIRAMLNRAASPLEIYWAP